MKRVRLLLVFAVLMALLSVGGSVLAQGPSGGTTGVQAVNISSGSIGVLAVYYAEDGTQYTLPEQTLPSMGDSYTYYAEPSSATSFSGAVILSADGSFVASANTEFSGGLGAGYNGFSEGSLSVLLPVVMYDYFGGTSILGIQNTDTTAAKDIKVTFTQQGGTPFDKTYTVQAGASRIIDLNGETGFTSGWLGAAVVAPDDGATLVVATVMNYKSGSINAYSGFTQTGDVYYLPLIRSEFAGKVTGIGVVDANSAANGNTTVAVAYTGFVDLNGNYVQDPGEEYDCSVQATLPDDESITFYNSGSTNFTTIFGGSGTATVTGGQCQTNGDVNFAAAGGPFLGSAVVTASGSTSPAIAVQVNDEKAGSSQGSYKGYLASEAGSTIIAPVARSSFAGKTTGTQIQLITGTSVACTGTYATSPLSTNTTTPPTKDLAVTTASPSATYYLPSDWTTGLDPTHGNGNWLGSLTIVCTGGTVVGEINDEASGIDASVYNTFKVQ